MPFISTKTNVKMTDANEKVLREKLGEAISMLPGKSETWLMLSLEDGLRMAFAGSPDPCAMIQVTVYGRATPEAYRKFTRKVTEIVSEELGISPDRIYIAYGETENWGWSGSNF